MNACVRVYKISGKYTENFMKKTENYTHTHTHNSLFISNEICINVMISVLIIVFILVQWLNGHPKSVLSNRENIKLNVYAFNEMESSKKKLTKLVFINTYIDE